MADVPDVPEAPDDPDSCLVYLYTASIAGAPKEGIRVDFRLSALPSAVGFGWLLSGERQTAQTDSNGLLQISLVRTDLIVPEGRYYIVESEDLGLKINQLELETETLDLSTLIQPPEAP